MAACLPLRLFNTCPLPSPPASSAAASAVIACRRGTPNNYTDSYISHTSTPSQGKVKKRSIWQISQPYPSQTKKWVHRTNKAAGLLSELFVSELVREQRAIWPDWVLQNNMPGVPVLLVSAGCVSVRSKNIWLRDDRLFLQTPISCWRKIKMGSAVTHREDG